MNFDKSMSSRSSMFDNLIEGESSQVQGGAKAFACLEDLIQHFVEKYPEYEDFDETVESVLKSKKAAKKMEETADYYEISVDVLKEILEAKKAMDEPTFVSIFTFDEEGKTVYKFLKQLLAPKIKVANENDLET